MRHITLGGVAYPVRATMQVDRAITERLQGVLTAADNDAAVEAAAKGLTGAELDALTAQKRKAAVIAYSTDTEVSLWQIALMINAAVDYVRIIEGRDIASEVPGYPMTAEKIAAVATAADLNREETFQTIAEEFAECRGGDAKNLTAEQLMEMAKKLLS